LLLFNHIYIFYSTIYIYIHSDTDEHNPTSDASDATESDSLSSSSVEDDINEDEYNEDNQSTSFVSISLPPSPFAYDPYDSYDWEC